MKDVYTQFVSHMLFPLHEKLKGHDTVAKRSALEKSQWCDEVGLKRLQRDNLTAFLVHLSRHNAYFKKVMNEADLSERDLAAPDILSRLPVLTKDIIREHESDMLSDDCVSPQFRSTSGSSGTPLRFVTGKARISHDVAAKWRATRWWGVDIGDKEAVIWGSDIEISGQGLFKRLRDGLFRSRLFPAKHLNSRGLGNLIDGLSQFQPAMIYAYPSIMCLLAEHILTHNIDPNLKNLKVVFCTAEKLYNHQRELIESAFKVKVADGYGSRDAGFIAHQCPAGGLHICAEDIVVEVLDTEGKACPPGEIGELVVTHTATRDFPMLRYQTGDMAKLSPNSCACGRGLPLFEEVMGRSNDVLKSTDGTAVHGAYIGNIVREDDAVRQFQLVQEAHAHFTLKLIAYEHALIGMDDLRAKLHEVLGGEALIDIEIVDRIDAEKSGKYKYIINKMAKV